MSELIINEVVEQMREMPDNLQQQVLQFTRSLKGKPVKGAPGKNLLRFAGTISPEDLEIMEQTIEEGCEQVNLDEW